MRKGDNVVEQQLVLERPRYGGINAYITLSLNGTVDVGEVQIGNPSKRQQRIGIYSQEQVELILNQRGLSKAVYSFA